MADEPETRARILAAAKSSLLQVGYANLSTHLIADTAGVPLSQIHYHFGSKQKLVLARELASSPQLVLAAHATRGLDVSTIDFVLRELLRARYRGAGVLLLSSDLDEIWKVADRTMVMSHGHLHGPVPLSATSRQEVGHLMTGTA